MTFDVAATKFRNAVVNIQRRAEKQEFEEKLARSFVPTQVIEELQTDQNQLVFGRRGVGKTHTLKVFLASKVQEGFLCTYLDCTTFGSGLASDGSEKNTGVRFFSKFVYTLATNLLDHVIRLEKASEKLVDACIEILGQLQEASSPNLVGETFNYAEIVRLLRVFMVEIGTSRLFIIVDEWAQIPMVAQPFFAEFLKRSVFAAPKITLKIAVVDYAYKLTQEINGSIIGLEKSADIFSDVRMDSHFVWDEKNDSVEQFFAVLLYNHIALELDVSIEETDAAKAGAIKRDLFTQDRAFSELCRASEGNARDFLVMFGRAHSDFRKQTSRERVGLPDVQRAAINWYREDKLASIATEGGLEEFLQYLIDDVISKKRSRAFMVPATSVHHPLLRRLFAARLLHPLTIEWSHPDKPGERYNLVSIDYGTYASFKGTKNEPFEEVLWPEARASDVALPPDLVPLKNDRRSIRRIVITPEVLDEYWRP